MDKLLPSLSVLFRNSKTSLMYGSMAAITIGFEELSESVVFNCPCEGHYAYGLAFLWAPAVLLFLPGILLDRTLWRHPRNNTREKSQATVGRYFKTLLESLGVFIRAGIPLVVWLVVSFLQQQYYTCAYFGPPLESAAPVTNTSDKCYPKLGIRSTELEQSYKTHSQIAGWLLMLIAVSILFTSICIHRCVKKGKHLRLPSLEYYRHVEAKEALEQFHTKAKELAKQNAVKNIELLFQCNSNKDFDVQIQEVSKTVSCKYSMFFVIPPESPAYETPAINVDNPPQFPFLFTQTDGAEFPKKECNMHSRPQQTESLKQRQSAYENYDRRTSVSKVRRRQISVDAV